MSDLFAYIREQRDRGVTPKYVFNGTGQVRKHAVGRFIAQLLRIGDVQTTERSRVKSRLAQLLWTALNRGSELQGFERESRKEFVLGAMEEMGIPRSNEVKKKQIIKETKDLWQFFIDEVKKHEERPCDVSLETINERVPDKLFGVGREKAVTAENNFR